MEPTEPFWRKQAAAFDAFLSGAYRQGFVTYSELNQLIPENAEPDEIEDLISMLSEMGVNVVEDDV